MKKEHQSPGRLLDQHLKSVEGMQEAATDPFFYTRLVAKMERRSTSSLSSFKPVWAIAVLAMLLVLNSVLLVQQQRSQPKDESTLQGFATEYDLTIPSSF